MIIFIFCLLVFAGILYNFIKYRKDDECIKIYGAFAFVTYIAVIISCIRIIPVGIFKTEFAVNIFMMSVMFSIILAAFIFLRKIGRSSMRGAVLITAVCIAAIILPLKENITYQINEIKEPDSVAMQEIYDRCSIASDYAKDKLIDEFKIDNRAITKMAYGFVPGDDIEYFVAFAWDDGFGNENKYGYKIYMDDIQKCTIAERGKEIGTDVL